MNESNDTGEEWVVRVSADTTPLRRSLADAEYLGSRFSSALTNAFEGIALKGKSLGDVLKSLALSLSDLVLKAALQPLQSGLGNLFSGLFSGLLGGSTGFANGGVLNGGLPSHGFDLCFLPRSATFESFPSCSPLSDPVRGWSSIAVDVERIA